MSHSEILLEAFDTLVRPLIGLPVSLPWKGFGSTIFLELGQLAPRQHKRQVHERGEACISIDWDWRIECGPKVLFGSSSNGAEIAQGLRSLQGRKVEGIAVSAGFRELIVSFSDGWRLNSMVMHSDEPQWSIKRQGPTWISSSDGRLFAGDGGATGLTDEETAAFSRAEAAASRWGTPVQNPKLGNCQDCTWYVPLGAYGHFLDFGGCANEASPFDGRIVDCQSGCPAFHQLSIAPDC